MIEIRQVHQTTSPSVRVSLASVPGPSHPSRTSTSSSECVVSLFVRPVSLVTSVSPCFLCNITVFDCSRTNTVSNDAAISQSNSISACSGVVSRLLEHAWCNAAAMARSVFSGACLLTLSPILCLILSSRSVARLVLFKFAFGRRLDYCVTCSQPLVANFFFEKTNS